MVCAANSRAPAATRVRRPTRRQNEGLNKPSSPSQRFQSFDLLATLVAVVRGDGTVLFANSALEDAVGSSRRTIEGASFLQFFLEPHVMRTPLAGARINEYAALRYDARLVRQQAESIPVHVVLAQTDVPDEFLIELLP